MRPRTLFAQHVRVMILETERPATEPQTATDHRRLETGLRAMRHAKASNSGYEICLAESRHDLEEAQSLRFQVFNLEMNEGLESSFATRRDADPFDDYCDHLVVRETLHGEVVGTYRLQTGRMARHGVGLYCATEFDMNPFEPVLVNLIELGRACVHRNHRNAIVLGMLWREILAYARERHCRFLVGCSSIPSREPAEGTAAFRLLESHLAEMPWRTEPWTEWRCPLGDLPSHPVRLPRLLRAYLSLGARICGPPACDRAFGTIDFLTFLDLESLKTRTSPGGA